MAEGREPLVKVTGDSLDSLFEAYFGDESDEFKQVAKDKYAREIYVLKPWQTNRANLLGYQKAP